MSTIQPFDPSVNLLRALLWQYDQSERLRALIEAKQAWYDANQRDFWTGWYRDVFDLRTANEFGLSVWAIILDVPLVFGLPASGSRPVWGLGTVNRNFNRGTFGRKYSGVEALTTDQKRIVLQLRYFQLVTRGAVSEVNFFIRRVLGDVYVLDGLDMACTYVFRYAPSAQLRQILQNFDLLPRPAGVEVDYLIEPGIHFGFGEYNRNFERGEFYGAQ